MSRKEIETSEPQCLRHYDEGFEDGKFFVDESRGWINIADQAPEEKKPLLYFFECTGVSAGYYYGIEADYCPETGHQFGGPGGWLTGDVTHWQYYPGAPEGFSDSHFCSHEDGYMGNAEQNFQHRSNY